MSPYQSNQQAKSDSDCPECGGKVDVSKSMHFCEECGFVVNDTPVDHGPEWREFTSDDMRMKRRTATTTDLQYDQGLGSEIGSRDSTDSLQLHRMRKQNSRLTTKVEKGRVTLIEEVKQLGSHLNLSREVKLRAANVASKAHDDGYAHGTTMEAVATAGTIAAAREAGAPVTLDDIEEYSDQSISVTLTLLYRMYEEYEIERTILAPAEYVPRIASQLDLPPLVREGAVSICRAAQEANLHSGHAARTIAAAAVYTAAKKAEEAGIVAKGVTQSECVGADPTTIRKHLRRFKQLDEPIADLAIPTHGR